jgi:hypothetical protein
MTSTKGVIVGIFVKKDKILSFLELLKNKFKIKSDKVFIHSIDTNKFEYLVTFKAYDKDRYIKSIKGSTVMHVKNNCIFSINALNKLIEKEAIDKSIPNNEYIINWERYRNKLIMVANGELYISNLEKIEDKSVFFN